MRTRSSMRRWKRRSCCVSRETRIDGTRLTCGASTKFGVVVGMAARSVYGDGDGSIVWREVPMRGSAVRVPVPSGSYAAHGERNPFAWQIDFQDSHLDGLLEADDVIRVLGEAIR